MSSHNQQVLILSVVIGTIAIIAGIILWTQYFYGKNAKQLENILNEIDE
ncbi:hypothetical protein [Chryseobacterium sp. ERMR1:04]|nr:hypothetical protein [Chryseobacterium sp. ERMR1:04]